MGDLLRLISLTGDRAIVQAAWERTQGFKEKPKGLESIVAEYNDEIAALRDKLDRVRLEAMIVNS